MGRRRRRRVTRLRVFIILILCIGIAAAVLLGLFRISVLEIQGSQRHTVEEIEQDLVYDFWTENTLFFAWKYRNAVEDSNAPYLSSIQAKIASPGKVRLTVQEKPLYGYVQYAGENVYFDSEGTALEITSEVYADVPLVSGVTMDEPTLYQRLPMDNAAQMGAMLKITELLVKAEFIPDNISFDENLNITLAIGSVTVNLGQNDCLDEKVANLVSIYPEIRSQAGTLHMETFTGKNDTITFTPNGQEVQTQGEENNTENQDGSAAASGENAVGEAGNGTDGAETAQGAEQDGGEAAQGAEQDGGEAAQGAEQDGQEEVTGVAGFMVFDSSGTLRYDARVVNGQVVDANGTPIDGCTVDENGNVVDAYMNVIDPTTGELAQ